MGAEYAVDRAADPGKAGLIGAALSGALGGLAGGPGSWCLTFGAGAVLGGILAPRVRAASQAPTTSRGAADATTVRWSAEFMTAG